MAARLPLILSQPARRDATATDLIENIVAAALLLPKLDANLIGDISTIEPGSTDHLCLQGLGRDVILASFLEMPTAQSQWQRLGQAGQFIDCSQPTESIRRQASGSEQRRVFYFQLAYGMKVPRLLDQCHELVSAQAVQLVSIQLGGTGQSASLPIVGAVSSPAKAQARDSVPARPAAPPPTARPTPSRDDSESDEDWSSIDKLVDELDAMDI